MRKELIWAGVIGISFGLIIAFGVWRINSSLKPKNTTPLATNVPKVSDTTITLDKPENNDVVTATPITVSGITKPATWLIFSGEKNDYILKSDVSGIFSQNMDLIGGVNQIKVTSLDAAGGQSYQKVLVVYSSTFQTNAPIATDNAATDEPDIRQKVAQKVAQALNQPKAYIGTITDISDSTIQIKNMESQIEQIATGGKSLTVVNLKGTNNKTVKLTDIAIGDFIVALGYINQKSVLDAQRILIIDPIVESNLYISMAKVLATSKQSLTVTNLKNGVNETVTIDKNTSLKSFSNGKVTTLKFASITKDSTIIYTSGQSGTPVVARSIFVIN